MYIQKMLLGNFVRPARLVFKQNMSMPAGPHGAEEHERGKPRRDFFSEEKPEGKAGESVAGSLRHVAAAENPDKKRNENKEIDARQEAFHVFKDKFLDAVWKSFGNLSKKNQYFKKEARYDEIIEAIRKLDRASIYANPDSFRNACEQIAGVVYKVAGPDAVNFNELVAGEPHLAAAFANVIREENSRLAKRVEGQAEKERPAREKKRLELMGQDRLAKLDDIYRKVTNTLWGSRRNDRGAFVARVYRVYREARATKPADFSDKRLVEAVGAITDVIGNVITCGALFPNDPHLQRVVDQGIAERQEFHQRQNDLLASVQGAGRQYKDNPELRTVVARAKANLAAARTVDELIELERVFGSDVARIEGNMPGGVEVAMADYPSPKEGNAALAKAPARGREKGAERTLSSTEIKRRADYTRRFAAKNHLNLAGLGVDPGDDVGLYNRIRTEQERIGLTGDDIDGRLGQTTWQLVEKKDPDTYLALFMPEQKSRGTAIAEAAEEMPATILATLDLDHVWRSTEALTSTDGRISIGPNELVHIEGVAAVGKTVTVTRFNGERGEFVVSRGRLVRGTPAGQMGFAESYLAEAAKRAPDSRVVVVYSNGNRQEFVAKKAVIIAKTRDPEIIQYKLA